MTLEERVSTLEAELAELRTLLTPTRQRAELVKQSKEQAKREARLQRWKEARIMAMVKAAGHAYCEKCHSMRHPQELEVHHIRARSLGGSDETGNLQLLDRVCHEAEETPEAISSRRESQQGAAGKCEKLLKNRLSE